MKTKTQPSKLEYAQLWNGKFAICPRCGQTMAHNACGGWWCIFGCGLKLNERGGKQ